MKKKILIVEDEALIAQDLKAKLIRLDFEVVGVVYNSDRVTDAIVNKQPDLILLDINIKGTKNGIEIAHVINRDFSIPFIFVTSYSDSKTLEEVKATAPLGFILKPFDINDLRVELEMALFRLAQKQKPGFPDFESLNKALRQELSPREFEIILDIKTGLNNTELAAKLFVSVNTIKSHLKNIYRKCNVSNRVELLEFCYGLTN